MICYVLIFEGCIQMNKLIWAVTAALFLPTLAEAGQRERVESCLKGRKQTPSCRNMLANYWKHDPVIERGACLEGVDPRLMKSLIAYESMYNNNAVSPVSATGLTQVMPATAMSEFGLNRSRLYHPETSVRAGARYLTKMHRQFGRLDLALAAYNAGPGRVKQAGNRVPNIRETQAYVSNVTALYTAFKQKFPGQQCVGQTAKAAATTTVQTASNGGRVTLPSKPTFGSYGATRQKQAAVHAAKSATRNNGGVRFSQHGGTRFGRENSRMGSLSGNGIYSN